MHQSSSSGFPTRVKSCCGSRVSTLIFPKNRRTTPIIILLGHNETRTNSRMILRYSRSVIGRDAEREPGENRAESAAGTAATTAARSWLAREPHLKPPSPSSTAIGSREHVKEGKISTSPFRELEKFVTVARRTCSTIVLTALAKSGDLATYYLAYFTTRSPSATFPSVSLSLPEIAATAAVADLKRRWTRAREYHWAKNWGRSQW